MTGRHRARVNAFWANYGVGLLLGAGCSWAACIVFNVSNPWLAAAIAVAVTFVVAATSVLLFVQLGSRGDRVGAHRADPANE